MLSMNYETTPRSLHLRRDNSTTNRTRSRDSVPDRFDQSNGMQAPSDDDSPSYDPRSYQPRSYQPRSSRFENVAPMQTGRADSGLSFYSTLTNADFLYGLQRSSQTGFATLRHLSTIDFQSVQFVEGLLTNVQTLVIWVQNRENSSSPDPLPNTIEISDATSIKDQVLRADAPLGQSFSGDSNSYQRQQKNRNFIAYYNATRQTGDIPMVYGKRSSLHLEKVSDIAVELSMTLKLAQAGVAPIVYAFYLTEQTLHNGEAYAKATYLVADGVDFLNVMNAMHERSDLDLADANVAYPRTIDLLGRQFLELIQRTSQERVVLSDIKAENMIVFGLDMNNPDRTTPLLRFIDFEPRFAAEIELERADYNCIFVLNGLLALNQFLTRDVSGLAYSKTFHEIVVRFLQPLVSMFRSTIGMTYANSSEDFNKLCYHVLKVAKTSPLWDYDQQLRDDTMHMQGTDTDTQAMRILERLVSYGDHDRETDSGMRGILTERRAEDVVFRLTKRLLGQFDMLKTMCDM